MEKKKNSSCETQTVQKTLKGDSKQKRTLYIKPVLGGGGGGGVWSGGWSV